jgi:hypothetical protein
MSLTEQAIAICGWQCVSTALHRKTECKIYLQQNALKVSNAQLKLASLLQDTDKARDYLQALDTNLQHTIINNWLSDLSFDAMQEIMENNN